MKKEETQARQASTVPICRVAIYARYSSDLQSPTSADDQINRIRHYGEKGLIRFIRYPGHQFLFLPEWIIRDEAESGKTASREGLIRLKAGIRAKEFDAIIVDDLSRMARELGNQLDLFNLLRFHQVELYSLCEGISSESASAKTFFQIKGVVNELGNDIHAMRTKRGQEARVMKGYSAGDICYGYRSEPTETRMSGGRTVPSHYKIVVHPEEAKVINMIYDLKLKGMGLSAIARRLNTTGVPSTERGRKITGKNQNWNTSAVRKILTREKYVGVWRWGKASRIIEPETKKAVRRMQPQTHWIEHMEGKQIREDLVIVPIDKWQAAQKMIAQTTESFRVRQDKTTAMKAAHHVASKNGTLLAGVLRCHVCGSPMLQVTGTKGGFYGCYAHHRKGDSVCANSRLLKRAKVETKVVDAVQTALLDPATLELATVKYNEMIRGRLTGAPNEIKDLQRRKSEAGKEITNLMAFIMRHGDMSESVKVALAKKEMEARACDERIRVLQAASADKLFMTTFALRQKFENLTAAFQRDAELANVAMRRLAPDGLVCTPSVAAGAKNHNQHNSFWKIEGRLLVAPQSGFSFLELGGG